jgi:glycosyltransferase involved in cell wall biosynthesis
VKLSVAMCTYNGARYVRAQLESIAAQTRPPDELVVCDDRSTDATRGIVEAFAASASIPLRLYVNERNLGSTGNFERAIGLCAGEVIALADQDDVWRPEKLARMAAVLHATPEVGLVFSDAELVDAVLRPLGRRLWDVVGGARAVRQLGRRERAFRLLLPGWTVTGATMAFRAEFRPLILPIPTNIAMIHDGWIALMISAVARIHFIDEPLMLYRQHGAQQIGVRSRRQEARSVLASVRRAPSAYADTLGIIAETRQRLRGSGLIVAPRVLGELEALTAHFDVRRRLPDRWLRRVPLVLREVLSCRYRRYGNGLKSAAKDLVIGS